MEPIEQTPASFEAAGKRYELRANPWPHAQGVRWIPRLTAMWMQATAAARGEAGVDGVAFMAEIFSDTDLFVEFVEACERNTEVIERGETGEATRVPFDKIKALLVGQLAVTTMLVRAHVEVQWAPFFASSFDVMGDLLPMMGVGGVRDGSP